MSDASPLVSLGLVGPAAVDEDLRSALLGARSTAVRAYALHALAASRYGTAWDDVLSLLPKIERWRPSLPNSGHTIAIGYLIAHAGSDAARVSTLAAALRECLPRIDPAEAQWLLELWPSLAGTSGPVGAPCAMEAAEWLETTNQVVTGQPLT
jgi:hypothetical protein